MSDYEDMLKKHREMFGEFWNLPNLAIGDCVTDELNPGVIGIVVGFEGHFILVDNGDIAPWIVHINRLAKAECAE